MSTDSILTSIAHECIQGPTVKRAFYVALVVGTMLNLINRYDILFLGAPLSSDILLRMSLTFMVPYMVSTHGQVSARLALRKSSG